MKIDRVSFKYLEPRVRHLHAVVHGPSLPPTTFRSFRSTAFYTTPVPGRGAPNDDANALVTFECDRHARTVASDVERTTGEPCHTLPFLMDDLAHYAATTGTCMFVVLSAHCDLQDRRTTHEVAWIRKADKPSGGVDILSRPRSSKRSSQGDDSGDPPPAVPVRVRR